MPRKARIDIPGQVYHVISRGIERREIFLGEEDYMDFKQRASVWLDQAGAKCLAWCLMPNHFHFLVMRGAKPLSEMMHHIMTGYAVNFNLRHHRVGHLFQNRYKAIICDLEEYLLELVPYIHLNPLRAGLVKDLAELEDYKWCGHGATVRNFKDNILDRAYLLDHFGDDDRAALLKYMQTMAEKAADREHRDLSGGGRLRSAGGCKGVFKALGGSRKELSDQRILGESDFVAAVLREAGEVMAKRLKSREELLTETECLMCVPRLDIFRHTRERRAAQARAVYCHLCREAGYSGTALTMELDVSDSAVSRLAVRGRKLVEGKMGVVSNK